MRMTPRPPAPPGSAEPPPHADPALRLIAAFKFAKALTLVAVAAAALGLLGGRAREAATSFVVRALARVGEGSEFRAVHALVGPWLARALDAAAHWLDAATPGRLAVTASIALGYAALLGVEGFGLWTARPWAEWVSVLVTASLIPFELYEVAHRITVVRVVVLVLNVLVVWYLVARIRRDRDRRGGAPAA